MRISDIKKLFSGVIDILSFKRLINNEVILYERLHSKKGTSISIELIEDDILFFGKSDFVFLCKSYIVEELNQYEISYIVEAILLSSYVKFENDLIEDDLDFLCITGDYGRLSKEEIMIIMNRVISQ